MTSYIVFCVLSYLGAVLRVTRLCARDYITEPVRIFFLRRDWNTLAVLSSCDWCLSIWIAAALTWPLHQLTGLSWWLIGGVALSSSWITGMVARFDADDEIVVEQ